MHSDKKTWPKPPKRISFQNHEELEKGPERLAEAFSLPSKSEPVIVSSVWS